MSFSVEVKIDDLPSTGKTIGVDLGLKHLATLSTGEKIAAPKKYAGRLRYLKNNGHLVKRYPCSRQINTEGIYLT